MSNYGKKTGPGNYLIYTMGQEFAWTDEAGNGWTCHLPAAPLLAGQGYLPVAPAEFNPATHRDTGALVDDGATISHVIEELTPEELVARLYQEAAAISEIEMRQCRRQLDIMGVLDAVTAAISQMPSAAQIDWEFATAVHRNNPLVAGIATMMGWQPQDVDLYFLAASKL